MDNNAGGARADFRERAHLFREEKAAGEGKLAGYRRFHKTGS
jgi:hypothetical protein